ncbi:MAG: ferrochelatase [Planctomycetaceae bacterium]|nr:ferrochelatase [Planctomycetaceae bacterium]
MATEYDAILFVSFGGPEGPDDVIPFLENVLRGRNVPRERLLEVAEHYNHFGGVSPINDQCRELIAALETELQANDIHVPIKWGNRNWHPMMADTMADIKASGAKRILAFVTSGFSCYSGCRQYREDVYKAQDECDANDIEVHKIRVFFNHPDFVAVNAENVGRAIDEVADGDRSSVNVAFTAHSIPDTMASTSDYVKQLSESCRLVAAELGLSENQWELVYQSRSGRPQDPWLEPDICDHIESLHGQGVRKLVVSPIGFLSDHMEVMYDLDDEALQKCRELGVAMARAATPGTHPRFVSMIRKLIQERMQQVTPECIGQFPANHDVCPQDCCPAPPRRPPGAGRPGGGPPASGRPGGAPTAS